MDKSRKGLPLAGYTLTVGAYCALLGRFLWKNRSSLLSLQDMALLGAATHKLSRTITRDVVTTPFRAPFTRFQEFLGYGEVMEEAKGEGVSESIGELLSCNYCADPWLALGLLYGLSIAPEQTRLFMKLFTAVAIADFLHVGYETTRTRENVLTLREEHLERRQKQAA